MENVEGNSLAVIDNPEWLKVEVDALQGQGEIPVFSQIS